MTIKCPYCGYENPDSASFCGNCAENILDDAEAHRARLVVQQFAHQRERNTDWQGTSRVHARASGCTGCIIAIIILAVVGVILFSATTSIIETTSTNQKTKKRLSPKSSVLFRLSKKQLSYKPYNLGYVAKSNYGSLTVFLKSKRLHLGIKNGKIFHPYEASVSKSYVWEGTTYEGTTYSIYRSQYTQYRPERKIIYRYFIYTNKKSFRIDENIASFFDKDKVASVAVGGNNVFIFTTDESIYCCKLPILAGKGKRLRLDKKETLYLGGVATFAFYNPNTDSLYYTDGSNIFLIQRSDDESKMRGFQRKISRRNIPELEINEKLSAFAVGKQFTWLLTDKGKIIRKPLNFIQQIFAR